MSQPLCYFYVDGKKYGPNLRLIPEALIKPLRSSFEVRLLDLEDTDALQTAVDDLDSDRARSVACIFFADGGDRLHPEDKVLSSIRRLMRAAATCVVCNISAAGCLDRAGLLEGCTMSKDVHEGDTSGAQIKDAVKLAHGDEQVWEGSLTGNVYIVRTSRKGLLDSSCPAEEGRDALAHHIVSLIKRRASEGESSSDVETGPDPHAPRGSPPRPAAPLPPFPSIENIQRLSLSELVALNDRMHSSSAARDPQLKSWPSTLVREGASSASIAEAEERLGHTLPSDFCEFMRITDGLESNIVNYFPGFCGIDDVRWDDSFFDVGINFPPMDGGEAIQEGDLIEIGDDDGTAVNAFLVTPQAARRAGLLTEIEGLEDSDVWKIMFWDSESGQDWQVYNSFADLLADSIRQMYEGYSDK